MLGTLGSVQQARFELFPASPDTNFSGCGRFLFFFAAIEKGKVSTIIGLSSLYPVVTIALSVLLLHEKITKREGLGIALALTAGWLLAG